MTGLKVVEAVLENAVESHEEQSQLLDLVTKQTPKAEDLQNSSNVIWKNREQFAPILTGLNLTGQETGIIEEGYPCVLGDFKNDLVEQNIDNLRDISYWERRGRTSGKRQASNLNKEIAQAISLQGSLFYRKSTASGFDFIAEGQTILNERQGSSGSRCYVLGDRDQLKFAKDLANTVQGNPTDVWAKGQIAGNVAGFDKIYTGSYLPNLVGGADPATTVTGAQTFAPEEGSVDPVTLAVTNIDYRTMTIPVAASAAYNVGDKVTIANGGTTIKAVGLEDKTNTNQPMTATVVGKPDGTSLTLFPKFIAEDDGALSVLEKSYANVDTTITNGATVNRINTDAIAKANLFWDKEAVEVMTGELPAELFAQFGGMKVANAKMKNGQTMYMLYDGDITKGSFKFRLLTWHGITVSDPMKAGCSVSS